MIRRVVITGIGPVTSAGIGKDLFFENIMAHKLQAEEIPERFEVNYKFNSRYYIPFKDFSLSDYGFPSCYEHIMQMKDKIALLGSKIALEDAGFEIVKKENRFFLEGISDGGVIIGIGLTGLETVFNSYISHIVKTNEKIPNALKDTKIRYNRMTIPMVMPNSISAWCSIIFGLQGNSHTVNASCASGTYAIGESFLKIKNGLNDIMLAGGVEYLHDDFGAIMAGFDILGVLTNSKDGNPSRFSKERNGFLFSEGGGCIIVLEELEHAIKRRAHIYAEIIDYRSNNDAYNIIQISPTGSQIIKLLKDLKGDKKIDYLNSHGTGTYTNDEIEAQAIIEVFGDKQNQPYINSTKGIIGHTIGASGAIETGVTALSIYHSKIHHNLIPAPIDNINLVTKPLETIINYALSTSYGFGGHNAGLLFKGYKNNG